jgi:carboxyl-terminal processing protease
MTIRLRAFLVVAVGCVLGLTLTLGARVFSPAEPDFADSDLPLYEARLLAEVMNRVKREYVDQVDDERLLEAAIRGMVADLDPHSQFLDEGEYHDIRVGATGSYSGVGVEVTMDGNEVRVIAPFEGSPADRAGIRPDDVIIAIDDVPVDSRELYRTVGRMLGPPGTSVHLSIMRDALDQPLQFSLIREEVRVQTVRGELLEPDYALVRISQFNRQTASELESTLARLERDNLTPLRGVVLDLRDNPGGLLDAAVDVADLFLDDGLIVSARGRSREARFNELARPGDVLNGASIAMLVNGRSASAAEIVAGALKDHRRATLIGTSTFGKGLVQTVMPLSRGQAIKLTTSRYYTPSGAYIQNKGITPDIVIHEDEAGEDAQLVEAIEFIKSRRLVKSGAR